MNSLNVKQLKDYKDHGFVAPINVFSLEETKKIKEEIEHIEKKWPEELIGLGRNNVHYISPVFDQVCHNSKILDAVESIIGKDILVGGTTLFIKDPDKKGFVRSEEHTSELQSHSFISYAVFCLKKIFF